jgi:hypothetical protein
MAKYQIEINGDGGEHPLRERRGESLEDALAELARNINITICLYRWHEPRSRNRGAVDSHVSRGGKRYDKVLLEVIVRQQIRR